MSKRSSRRRPAPVMRFFFDNEEVDLEGFFEAIVACGGLSAATVSTDRTAGAEAVTVEPVPRYRLTPKGRSALAAKARAGVGA